MHYSPEIIKLIPSWFSLELYSADKSLDLLDYYKSLSIRRLLIADYFGFDDNICLNNFLSKPNSIENLKSEPERLDEYLETIQTLPIEKISKKERSEYFKFNKNLIGQDKQRNQLKKLNLFQDSVWALSWSEVNDKTDMLDGLANENVFTTLAEKRLFKLESKYNQANGYEDVFCLESGSYLEDESYSDDKSFSYDMSTINQLREQGVISLYTDPIITLLGHDPNNTFIGINLDASDEKLASDFKAFLKSARKLKNAQQSKGSSLKESFVKVFKKFKILEYFDLKIWFALNNTPVTDYQLAQILYPNEWEKDITSILRKSTKKYLNEYLGYTLHRKIHSQITLEKNLIL